MTASVCGSASIGVIASRPVVEAVEALGVRSCTIDGEVIACRDDGLADFELLRYRRRDTAVTLLTFDLIELDGHDLRREPIEQRKAELARLLGGCREGLAANAAPFVPAEHHHRPFAISR